MAADTRPAVDGKKIVPARDAWQHRADKLKALCLSWLQAAGLGSAVVAVGLVQLTMPLCVALILRRQFQRWRQGKLSSVFDAGRLWLRHLLRFWLTAEAYFFMWYLLQHRRLSLRNIHVPPARKSEGNCRQVRRKIFERMLAALDEVSCKPPEPAKPMTTLGFGGKIVSPLANRRNSTMAASADVLLRQISSKAQIAGSANDLVRWVDSEENMDVQNIDEEVLQLSVKRAEVSGWFLYVPIEQITRGNLAEFLAEYFFRGSSVDEINQDPDTAAELLELTDRMASWAHMGPNLSELPNPKVQCMRLSRDPLPSVHRPFWAYVITHVLLPRYTRYLLERRGFRRYRAGSMTYWLRKGSQTGSSCPVVFCHGLGAGVMPYADFVAELCRRKPGEDIFCVDLPHIQMRPQEEVPSARELCACIGDMLRAWDHTKAHFVGHSFGTLVCAWTVRYMPEAVLSVSLIDPVCFLMCKSDLIYNAVYAERTPFTDVVVWLLSVVVFRELFVCHTLLRNFFWQQNNLWPEDLAEVKCLVVLSGEDRLVPAHSVQRHLQAECERRRLHREAKRSGGHVVIQTQLPPGRVRPLHSEAAEGDAQAPGAAEMRVRFFHGAGHGQFWTDPEMMEEVLQEVTMITA